MKKGKKMVRGRTRVRGLDYQVSADFLTWLGFENSAQKEIARDDDMSELAPILKPMSAGEKAITLEFFAALGVTDAMSSRERLAQTAVYAGVHEVPDPMKAMG